MTFQEIVSVSGVSGLKVLIGKRNDGLILSELDGSGKKFYSSRQNLFSPLESIGIYTDDDSTPLLDVMLEMQAQEASNPPVDEKSDADTLRNYLGSVLPSFDRDRVHLNDIRKLIKWYKSLAPLGVIVKKEEPAASEEKA